MTTPLVILGCTASGKSDVVMAIAESDATVEIVVVDSMQVYRHMEIGTAKPSPLDRARVPHHGLDLADPAHDYSVSEYAEVVSHAVEAVVARHHRAVLVAGTGLYLRSLTDPMEMPGRWPEVRAELELRCRDEGPEALHRRLAELDPVAADRMQPTNDRRVVRALEVVLGSGRPFSSFGPGMNTYPPVEFQQVGIQWPRAVLATRIEQRVHRMIAMGLVGEVRSLLERAEGFGRTARQALGYKELIEHLEGRITIDAAVAAIVQRTRQFAVRQERWFRRDPRIRWIPVHHDPIAEVLGALEVSPAGGPRS